MRAKALGPKPEHCTVDGCLKPVYAKFYCRNHYNKNHKWGTPTPAPKPLVSEQGCKHPGCTNEYKQGGYCGTHYQQFWLRGYTRDIRVYRQLRVDDNGRECTKCDKYKPWDEYYDKPAGKRGKQSHCKECWVAYYTEQQRLKRLRERGELVNV